jgi:hypothetical protein
MTQAQPAQAVGTVRETVSVCPIQLWQENLVQTGRKRIFSDPHVLMSIVPQAASFPDSAIAN